jgi:hypothetical protein
MQPRQATLRAALGVAVLLAAVPSSRAQVDLSPGRLLPLAVRDGRCECVLPASRVGQYCLIVGSLTRAAGTRRVTLATETSHDPVTLPLEEIAPDPAWQKRIGDLRERLDWSRRQPSTLEEYVPAANPPRQRVFHVFAREGDFQSADTYVTVHGELRALGQHCQVYVDRDVTDPAGLQPTVDDVVSTFDHDIYPRACATLGRALDVDRDGRFTILFTPWLGKMSGGKVSLGGFVRGSDFYRDLQAPYGNRCDLLYLNTDLKPGPYLRTLLAHEYAHAVIFSEHVFGAHLPGVPRQDEEGWLNEGLAHLEEDLHGYSWDNLDYRISAFLSAPERYALVVSDYYRAGLWRSHGNRGATYLFLRWCADRFGPDFPTRLAQTNVSGVTNVEVTTGERFADLFRQWCAALALAGTSLPRAGAAPLTHIDLHGPLGGRLLCGPRFHEMLLAGGTHEVHLAGTAAAYVLLHGSRGQGARLTVSAEPGTDLQVTLIRLPRRTARLRLRCEPGDTPHSVRLALTARGSDVTLDAAAWECLVPKSNRAEDTSFPANGARAWFGDEHLPAAETRRSATIPLPEADPTGAGWIFKLTATDAAGHHIAAWARP